MATTTTPPPDDENYGFSILTPREDTQKHLRYYLQWGDTPGEVPATGQPDAPTFRICEPPDQS